MSQTLTTTERDPRFNEFMEKSDALEGAKVTASIPREYLQPSVARGFLGFAVSLSVYVGGLVGVAVLDRWYLVAPLVVIAGLGGWGLHCIGHDCGHGSFSRNRRLNFVMGHVSLLPLLYPFHAWRHVHNQHHAHTNSLELDVDWRPISEAVYRRMPLRHRIIYVSMRTWAVWAFNTCFSDGFFRSDTSQRRTVPSAPALARSLPSAVNCRSGTVPSSWPLTSASRSPVFASKMRIRESVQPVAR